MSNTYNLFVRNSYKRRKFSIHNLVRYFTVLNLNIPHTFLSLIGFTVFALFVVQVLTGFILATSFIPESMLILASRETEDLEGYHIDDIFLLHERIVDLLFFILYGHILRKFYTDSISQETESSWKTGAILYIMLQVVVFFGIVLCSSQLSEISLRMAANVAASLTRFRTELDWILFTDRAINTDTMIRMTILHYLSGGLIPLLGLIHGLEMHYDWKAETHYTGLKEAINWIDEGVINELVKFLLTIWMFIFLNSIFFNIQEAVSYEIFTWFDLGTLDVKYKWVSPHWYFKPYMAWLNTLPDHYGGIGALCLFILLFYYQPDLTNRSDNKPLIDSYYYKGERDVSQNLLEFGGKFNPQYNLTFNLTFLFFVFSLWYTASFLPYGLMFHFIGGNTGKFISDLYIMLYLSFPSLRGQYSFFSVLIEIINVYKISQLSKLIDFKKKPKKELGLNEILVFINNEYLKAIEDFINKKTFITLFKFKYTIENLFFKKK